MLQPVAPSLQKDRHAKSVRTGTPGSRFRLWGAYAAAVGTLLAIWGIAALLLPDFLMPGIDTVARRIVRELGNASFWESLGKSFARLAIGYSLAVALGIIIGLLAGISPLVRLYWRALISILQSIPPITWVPLFLILMGFGDRPIITVITLAGFYPIALNVINATESVNPVHIQVARLMGASRKQLLTKVFLPEVLPAMITGTQIAFGNGWRALIAAEMIGGVSVGIGWSISFAGEIADMAGVLQGVVVIGTIAALIDRLLLENLKRRLLRWRFTQS